MTSEDAPCQIRRAAEAYGITLPDNSFEEYVREFESMVEEYEALDSTDPVDESAIDITEGDDGFNAFRHTFSLPFNEGDGPLADLQLGVKENIAVAGVPMTCGSAALSYTPETHATVVRRLVEAGGDVCATTNMDEFAHFTTGETSVHGPTDNPAAPNRVSGGSSSGSGAAVAAELLDAALGSDTGGSVRIPASYCGVVGLKPTYSVVPRFGFVDLAPSLDHIGILAKSVPITRRVLETIAGSDRRDPSTRGISTQENINIPNDIEGFRVGIVEEAMDDATNVVEEQIDTGVEIIAGNGVNVDKISLPTFAATIPAQVAIEGIEFAHLMTNYGQVYGIGTGYSECLRAAIDELSTEELGEKVTKKLLTYTALLASSDGREYIGAQRVREQFIGEVENHLAKYDALVLPTTPTTAPEYNSITNDEGFSRTISHTAPFNFTGHPALSVPCGNVDGRPVGLQIVTAYHDEATAFGLGKSLGEL